MISMLDTSFATGLSVGLAVGYLFNLIQKRLTITRLGDNSNDADVTVEFYLL